MLACGPGLLIGDLLFVEQVGPDLARSWMSGGRWGLQGQLPASKGQVRAARGDEWPPYRSGSGGGPKADTDPLFSAGRQEAWLSWGEAPGLAWTLFWTRRAQLSLPKRSLPSRKKVTQFLFPGLCQHGHREAGAVEMPVPPARTSAREFGGRWPVAGQGGWLIILI